MKELHHTNDIEIKLLPNRRFIYSNRRQNIVITAEHNATEITVLFPEEYEDYSKRVDFVNSKGKEWTEALYIPEYKKHMGGFNKTRFHFTLPTEVTTEGELKMQFIAYLPDESMTTVPFEVIQIDVLDGVLAFKKSARSNPDLLILAYNQSSQALFNSQRAVAKSENAVEIAKQADAQSQEAIVTANRTEAKLTVEIERATAAEGGLQAALDTESARAQDAESGIAANLDAEILRAAEAEQVLADDLAAEAQAREAGDDENAQAISEETVRAIGVESAISAAISAEVSRALAAEQLNADAIRMETERAVAAETEITANLAAEIQRVESDITAALNAETDAREQADNMEQAARIQADAENVAAIFAETQRAQTAEQINAEAISAEAKRAQSAENGLQAAITAEQVRATNAEKDLQSALLTEQARAISTEAELRADLNSETARAQTADQINANAITAEEIRATQAEQALGARIDSEVPAALTQAKAYADQVAEQVRIDGTIYKGTVDESELPTTGNENGDLYWISDFNITKPEHSGSAIWNGAANKWDFNIDRYKHQDNDTIVARDSDGALKVADTDEINLMADASDFGAVVQLSFKAMIRSIIRKIKGLFQKNAENAAAVTVEVTRAQTAESGLSSSIAAEVTRATAAEQINASATQTEAARAQSAESDLSLSIAAETARALTAEQTISSAIQAETARAQTAESGVSIRINSEETRAKAAEQANADTMAAETTRAQVAEDGLFTAIAAETTSRIAGDGANAQAIAAEITRALSAEAGKVDKVAGKGLSTEDYTTEEKSKLVGIDANANNYTHPTSHPPSIIAQDANNRFMADAERAKLAGIETGAQVNEVNEAPADNKQYARKNQGWAEIAEGTSDTVILPGGTSENMTTQTFLMQLYQDDRLISGTKFVKSNCAVGTPVYCDIVGTIVEKTGSVLAVAMHGYTCKVGGIFDAQYYVFNARVRIDQINSSTYHWAKHYLGNDTQIKANQNVVTDMYGRMVTEPKIDSGGLSIAQVTGNSTADVMSQKAVTDALGEKVDKVTGKGLSANDYTLAEKNKLAGVASGAQINEVNEAPADGKQYARKNRGWVAVTAVDGGGSYIDPDTDGGGLNCVNIQMEFYSDMLGTQFFLQAECLMPSIDLLLGDGTWDRIADNGYMIEDEELVELAQAVFLIAASGGKASATFMTEDGCGFTTPLSCLWAFSSKGFGILSYTVRLDGEDIDLIEMLGDAECAGIYVLPNSGNAPLGLLLTMM